MHDDTRPDGPVMDGVTLSLAMARMHLSRDQLSALLGIAPRTVERWRYDHRPIPPGIAESIRTMLREHDDAVAAGIAAADECGAVTTYRDTDAARAAGSRYPAHWWHAVAVRVSDARPDYPVRYGGV